MRLSFLGLLLCLLIGRLSAAERLYELEIFSLNYKLALPLDQYQHWLRQLERQPQYLVIRLDERYAYQHKIYQRDDQGLHLVAAACLLGDAVTLIAARPELDNWRLAYYPCKDCFHRPAKRQVALAEMETLKLLFSYLSDEHFFSVSAMEADKEITQIFRLVAANAKLEFVLESYDQKTVAKFFSR